MFLLPVCAGDPVPGELLPAGSRGDGAGLGGQRLCGDYKSPWEEVASIGHFE